MNEQVVKLLIESGLLVNASEYRVNGIDPKIKKFAELIVKKCLDFTESEDAARINIENYFGVGE